jgi:hypothetical protein
MVYRGLHNSELSLVLQLERNIVAEILSFSQRTQRGTQPGSAQTTEFCPKFILQLVFCLYDITLLVLRVCFALFWWLLFHNTKEFADVTQQTCNRRGRKKPIITELCLNYNACRNVMGSYGRWFLHWPRLYTIKPHRRSRQEHDRGRRTVSPARVGSDKRRVG